MNLDLVNNIFNDVRNNKFVQNFINELQNHIEKDTLNNTNKKIEGESIMITAKYRDKMNTEKAHILNNYAQLTSDKGQMFYIYDKNSKMEEGYNLCICEEGKSHDIIELSKVDLPDGATIGSVLRKADNRFVIDEEATQDISQEIYKMKVKLLNEQAEFLDSKRIEGHIYEMSDNDGETAWLFDITNGDNDAIEGIEEIDFPKELLIDGKEGALFIYQNGEYKKYSKD